MFGARKTWHFIDVYITDCYILITVVLYGSIMTKPIHTLGTFSANPYF